MTMVSRISGPRLNIFFILFLFTQGNYGEDSSGHVLGDGVEISSTSKTHEENPYTAPLPCTSQTADRFPSITGNDTSVREILWQKRMKKQWFRRPTKNVPIIGIPEGLLGDTWNDRVKTILVGITGMIPPIGGIPVGQVISLVLKVFWPSSKPDIWSLIKKQVEGLVDEKILKFELQERNNEIRSLQKTMQMYVEAQIQEKGSLMSTMIHASNELFYKLTQSENSVQLIPLVVTHSTQHLLILKERLLHGKEMYNEDNTIVWRNDLESQISAYKDFMKDIYSKWVEWRKSKITIQLGVYVIATYVPPFFTYKPYGTVYDWVTEDIHQYKYNSPTGPNNKNYFKPLCDALRENMFGFRNGELLQIMVTTFYMDNFIPGNEDNPSVIPPSMSIARFGPISPDIGGGDQHCHLYISGDDNTNGGDVTGINIREGYIIDGIQVFYSTSTGSFVGNRAGGNLHEFTLKNRRVKSIQFCDNYCNIVEMTIGFSSGESTGRLGNRDGWHVGCVNTGGIDTYGLYNVRMAAVGYCFPGVFQIGVDFKAYPTRPSQMDNRKLYALDLTQEKFQYARAIDVDEFE